MPDSSFPRFSIILCNHNHEEFLRQSLPAILGQLRSQDELLLVEDGSTDHSLAVMRELTADRENVRILVNERNVGVVRSGNRALHCASGDFVAWWGADDLVLDGFLEITAQALRQYPDAAVVASETIVETRSSGATATRKTYGFDLGPGGFLPPERFVAENRKRYMWLASSGLFVRREALQSLGGWREDLDWLCDWFSVYVISLRLGVAYVGTPCSIIREGADSYGKLAAHRSISRGPVVDRFFDLLATPEYADVRSKLRSAPLILSHAFGDRLFRDLARRVRDWDLMFAAAWAVARARIKGRFGGWYRRAPE